MLKKFIVINLISIPLHFSLWFLLIKTIATMTGPSEWFYDSNRFAYYWLWIALIPNVVYLISHRKEKGVVKGFFISSLLVAASYFVIANLFGLLYHS